MSPDPSDDRSWVPALADQRLGEIEGALSALGEWNGSPDRRPESLIELRLVEEALDLGWHELLHLIVDPRIPRETLDWFVDVCVEAVDVWRVADLPRQHAEVIEALAWSILELDEDVFVPDDYDPDADEDDPRSSYHVPWWS